VDNPEVGFFVFLSPGESFLFDPVNQILRNICHEVIVADLISISCVIQAEVSRLEGLTV
jgi:hypothetical protein